MKAVEHYLEAERNLEYADEARSEDFIAQHLACAQVHATLALAGATALQSYARVGDDDAELADWQDAAGGAT